MPVSFTFSTGGIIQAAQVNTNFSDVLNELGGLSVADLSANSGLLSSNLADRFATVTETIYLASHLREGLAVAPGTLATHPLPAGGSSPGLEVFRKNLTLRPGRAAYLVAIEVYAQNTTVATTDAFPAVWVTRNGTLLGGGEARITAADTRFFLKNIGPFDSPLTALADGDYLTLGLGTAPVSATDTTWAGVTVTFTYKFELGA